jgi:hypothetical protein
MARSLALVKSLFPTSSQIMAAIDQMLLLSITPLKNPLH